MRRWRSLVLTLPKELFGATEIMDHLVGVTPHLHSLEISNSGHVDKARNDNPPFPDLSKLQTMTIDGAPRYVLETPPNSLTYLDISCYGFDELRGMEQLRHLCLRNTDNHRLSKKRVTIPNLTTLHIYGHCDRVFEVIIAPRLDKLLVRSPQATLARSFPSVSSIEWCFHDSEAEDQTTRINIVTRILEKISDTSCLAIRGIPTETVESVANNLKKEGKVSASLKAVEVLVDDARTLVCNWV